MKTAISSVLLTILILTGGCLRNIDNLNTLQDYNQTFSHRKKISLDRIRLLTLSEAGAIALANNPSLLAAASSIKTAEYAYYRSMSAWSPEISVYEEVKNSNSRGYDLRHPPSGIFPEENRFSTSGTIRATWLLFNGLARELDIVVSRLEYKRNTAIAEDVKRLLLRAVAYTWCDILLSSEEILIFQADKAFQDAALKQAEQQFKSGHISYSTVLNFKVLSSKAQSKISIAKYNRQTAVNALASLLGYDSKEFPSDIELHPVSFTETVLHHPLDFYLEQAVRNRPDLKAEKLQFEKAFRQKQAAFAAFMPEIHLFADFSFDNASATYKNYAVRSSYYNRPAFAYGITGTWNLFRGFDSFNEIRRRNALEHVAKWGLNKKYLDVTVEVRDAIDNCRNTIIQTKIFQNMANWVLEQRELIYSEYLNGRETIARVNQAQSELVEARNSLALWKTQFYKAQAQLKAAIGTDAVPDIESIKLRKISE